MTKNKQANRQKQTKNKDNNQVKQQNNQASNQITGLQAQLKEKQKQIDTLKNELLKTIADFRNYQNRVVARQEQEKILLKREVFKDIILLFENLYIAIDQLKPELKDHPDIKGIVLILNQYKDILKKHGVQEISYKQDDTPDISNTEIIGQEPTQNKRLKGKVAKLVTPGYKIGDIVIKQARVIVYG